MSPLSNPRSLLTAPMRGVLERMARARRVPLHALPPQEARAFYAQSSGVLDLPPPQMARDETLLLPTRDGQRLHARLWVPHSGHEGAPAADWPVLVSFSSSLIYSNASVGGALNWAGERASKQSTQRVLPVW